MLAVIVCNIVTVALLIGLLSGIVVGFLEARFAVAAALAYRSGTGVRPRALRLLPA